MMQKILVALDHSQLSQEVFESALVLAQKMGAELQLLHVLTPGDEGYPSPPAAQEIDYYPLSLSWAGYYPVLREELYERYQQYRDAFAAHRLELLRSLSSQAETAGVKAEVAQIPGDPGRAICDFAQDTGIDLIIMGRRGRAGLSEWLLGSVSTYVTHHAPCSVMIVQGRSLPGSEGGDQDTCAPVETTPEGVALDQQANQRVEV